MILLKKLDIWYYLTCNRQYLIHLRKMRLRHCCF